MNNQKRTIILGTAGHIDHGKTSLVKAITGIDTDTLREEQERGITIDIGFAHWDNGITFIDVPGHERFIRNMIAGVNAIDYALMVVAADDGIMPQTLEHIDILRSLGIRYGAAVITKTDLVNDERIASVKNDITALTRLIFSEPVQIFTVSVKTGQGIEPLKSFLYQLPGTLPAKDNLQSFRMYIDRVFSKSGFGTVVTGTVLSGKVTQGDNLEMYPDKLNCRVRGIHKRHALSESARSGDRAALNITGIDSALIQRGSVLTTAGQFDNRSVFYAKIAFNRSVKPFAALRLLIGTAELYARLSPVNRLPWPVKEGYLKIHTSLPLPIAAGDRFILREKNAAGTVGGGVVAWPAQTTADDYPMIERIPLFDAACALDFPTVIQWFLKKKGYIDVYRISRIFGIHARQFENMIRMTHPEKNFTFAGKVVILREELDQIKKRFLDHLRQAHAERPSMGGIRLLDFQTQYFHQTDPDLTNLCLDELTEEGLIVKSLQDIRLADHHIHIDDRENMELGQVETLLLKELFQPPSPTGMAAFLNITEKECLRRLHRLIALKRVVKTGAGIYFSERGMTRAAQLTVDFIQKNNHISFQDFKRLTGVSRKFALAILEYFDHTGLTEREGEYRILNESDKK